MNVLQGITTKQPELRSQGIRRLWRQSIEQTPSKRRREPIEALNLAPLLPELSAEVDTDLLLRWKFRKIEFKRNIFLDLPVYLVHGKRKGSR